MHRYEIFFNEIATQIDLTKTEEETIIGSYEAIGNYLRSSDSLAIYNPNVFPQGSMRIGTTVKPLKRDDYDIDLVCELTSNTNGLTPQQVKRLVGIPLMIGRYASLLEEEHGRCWTLQYHANPPYHLDILPGIASEGDRVKATRKDELGRYNWLPTNPKGFAKWFLGLYKHKLVLDEKAGVEPVQTYGRRNVLQRAVQLIKRHRDVYFQHRKEDGPASIIITALSGLSYNGEQTIEEILMNGPIQWVSHIRVENGKYIIAIPGLNDDNYADKWNGEDKKAADLFFEWHAKLLADLDCLFAQRSVEGFLKVARVMFLDGTIDKVINENRIVCDALHKSFTLNASSSTTYIHPLFKHATSIESDGHRFIPRGGVTINITGEAFANDYDRSKTINRLYRFGNYSPLLEKDLSLRFQAHMNNTPKHYYIRWQITNTGQEAVRGGKKNLRGNFEYSEAMLSGVKYEHTSYAGTHFVQAFVIDKDTNNCVAKSNVLTINIGGSN